MFRALPHILGHEPAGVIAQVGSKVTHLRPGDRVVPHLFFTCGSCYFCRVGRDQQCSNLKGILGVLSPGAFAEYFKAPAANLFVLPDKVPFDVGGLVADAVVTSVHAVKRANLRLQDTAVVIGDGRNRPGVDPNPECHRRESDWRQSIGRETAPGKGMRRSSGSKVRRPSSWRKPSVSSPAPAEPSAFSIAWGAARRCGTPLTA